jgi:hypothetical protein
VDAPHGHGRARPAAVMGEDAEQDRGRHASGREGKSHERASLPPHAHTAVGISVSAANNLP